MIIIIIIILVMMLYLVFINCMIDFALHWDTNPGFFTLNPVTNPERMYVCPQKTVESNGN